MYTFKLIKVTDERVDLFFRHFEYFYSFEYTGTPNSLAFICKLS